MTQSIFSKTRIHPAAKSYAKELKQGQMDRREFLARSTALGVSAVAAYALAGLPKPAQAAGTPPMGGTLRVQMSVKPLKDTRTYDWSELGNQTRGTLEYLVEYNNDGSFRGMLLEGWEANEDATEYRLNVRRGVTWSNGEPFTAEDVARNILRWSDSSVEGNSMAGRVASLIDPATGRAAEGAVVVEDAHTVLLRLRVPDVTIIPGMSDYPSAVVHASYDPTSVQNIGTGPYLIEEFEVGLRCVLRRNPDHQWWGSEIYGGPYLDRIEYIDLGTDPAAWLAALESDEVDMLHQSVGEFIDVMDGLGFVKSEIMTGSTVVVRPNQLAEVDGRRPYADKRVRQALALAVDNAVCLELGYGNRGVPAENHHAAPVHPEYAALPPLRTDPEAARALMEEAGMMDFEHELVSIDDDWRKNTTDAVAAQLRDAGFKVKRTILPGATFWNDWLKYPFSSTDWNHRPLAVQIWGLAYRSGEAWNEFGWANPEFDRLLDQAVSIADADKRRDVAARMQKLIQDEGVTIQPYWRSIYRHARSGVTGAEQHIAFEHHHYKWAFAG